MKEKLLFIINPVSGKRLRKPARGLIEDKFPQDNYHVQIEVTTGAGEAPKLVKHFFYKGFRKVVAVGGDGTINEVASALVDVGGTLGIVPAGSGNGLARHLKIPLNAGKALDLIKRGKEQKIDYGLINDKKFFCTTGVGFDAQIGYVFSNMEGRGFVNYLKAVISEYRDYKPRRYEITFNGTTIVRDAFLITLANASQYGNNAYIAPRADISDGKLEVTILRPFPLVNAASLGLRLFLKNFEKSRYVESFQCERAIIKRQDKEHVHFDGEPYQMGEMLNIKAVKQGLNVIVG